MSLMKIHEFPSTRIFPFRTEKAKKLHSKKRKHVYAMDGGKELRVDSEFDRSTTTTKENPHNSVRKIGKKHSVLSSCSK